MTADLSGTDFVGSAADKPSSSEVGSWAQATIEQAAASLSPSAATSPLVSLLESLRDDGDPRSRHLLDTVDAMISPRQLREVAQDQGLHISTLRFRFKAISPLLGDIGIDITDPKQRLALGLEIAALRARDA